MLVGISQNGGRTHINNSVTDDKYRCPICNSMLIQKKGKIRKYHFAHKVAGSCNDTWHYDMSAWHCNWQNQFPKECQEIILEKNGEKHRADVCIDKTVIEFQHSRIMSSDFERRNTFYRSLGYKVVWVFDAAGLYGAGKIIENKSCRSYKWINPIRALQDFDCNPEISIFLQISENTWDIIPEYKTLKYEEPEQYGGMLLELNWKNDNCTRFTTKNIPDDFCDVDFLEKFGYGLKHALEADKAIGESIINLWRKNDGTEVAIFKDLTDNHEVMIHNLVRQLDNYNGKCYGKIRQPGYNDFLPRNMEIYGVKNPVWKMIWRR